MYALHVANGHLWLLGAAAHTRGMLTSLSMLYCWSLSRASYLLIALAPALSCMKCRATCMHHL